MKVDYVIDTVECRAEELRKSVSYHNEAASIATKILLIKKSVQSLSDINKLFNKISASDE
tara:strand:- start:388 stop:567 length:180 start_codon:yes stop_codon:yes gene_type:complete